MLIFALPRFGSDHASICLNFGSHLARPRIFHLDKSWYSIDNLSSLIQAWWLESNPKGYGAFILSKKTHFLQKSKPKKWASENFGSISIHKKSLLLELNSLDTISKSRVLLDAKSQCVSQLRLDLYSLHRNEEIYWKQHSRITWLKEGNANTIYFHFVANGRHNKNFIPRICFNGSWIKGNQNQYLGKVFSNQLGLLFGTSRSSRFLLD